MLLAQNGWNKTSGRLPPVPQHLLPGTTIISLTPSWVFLWLLAGSILRIEADSGAKTIVLDKWAVARGSATGRRGCCSRCPRPIPNCIVVAAQRPIRPNPRPSSSRLKIVVRTTPGRKRVFAALGGVHRLSVSGSEARRADGMEGIANRRGEAQGPRSDMGATPWYAFL